MSVEWINPDGTTGFHVDAGMRIYGGAFRGYNLTRKKSFRLLFKRDYGPTKLNFKLFEEDDATTSFDMIVLRAGANDGWNDWGRENTQYIIDEFMRRTQLALGQVAVHGTFVHLYLNGLYWGLYNVTERPVESFCAAYFGGDEEEWDAVNRGEARGDSNLTTWNAMLSQSRTGRPTPSPTRRSRATTRMGPATPPMTICSTSTITSTTCSPISGAARATGRGTTIMPPAAGPRIPRASSSSTGMRKGRLSSGPT